MCQKDMYDKVTQTIIDMLEKGVAPWRKPWKCADVGTQKSIRNRPYRGMNQLLLWATAMDKGYTDPRWVTFREAKKRNGMVRKGEKGTTVIFWKWVKKTEMVDHSVEDRSYCLIRPYTVFNIEQCDGIETLETEEIEEREHTPIEEAEEIVSNYDIEVKTNGGRAYYSPTEDYIGMPAAEVFKSGESYYSTLFHEMTHSTGHESRLGRDIKNVFGSHKYSKEELVAELGAAFMSSRIGLETDLESSAAYCQHWIARLKDDRKMLVTAAQQAQKAVDFIVGEEDAQ